jgi:type II secretory pathway component PulK
MGGARIEMNARQNRQGLALVAVLWIVIVMMAIVAIVGQTGRLNTKMAMSVVDGARCKWACRAGVETAIAVLNEDQRDSDCLSDLWSDNPEDFNDVQMERCIFTVRVTDEAGKLNVNTATKEQLMALPLMTSDVADSILDWRDTDDNPNPEGAEAGYYENQRYPYTIRNGPLHTTRELLRVKGVTEQQLYGEDANLGGQISFNKQQSDLGMLADSSSGSSNPGWIPYLTCYSYDTNVDAQGQTRVNINQASEQQLQTQLGISSAQARWIVQNRGSGFKSIADLINDGSPKESSGNSNSNAGTNNSGNSGNPGGNSGSSGGNTANKGGNPGNSGGNKNNSGGSPGNSGNGGNTNQPAEQMDMQTFRQVVDKITVTSETKIPGRVNVNTASVEVLTALFGGDDASRQIALDIVGDRAGRAYGFQSVGDLLGVSSMSTAKFKSVADLLTVRSNVFTIRCTALAAISRTRLDTECVVDRSSNPCAILYWYQGASN